jgi:hypothetical protein
MSVTDVNFRETKRKRKAMGIIAMTLFSMIVVAVSFTCIIHDSGKSDTSSITLETDDSEPIYTSIDADHSQVTSREVTVVNADKYSVKVDRKWVGGGVKVGDEEDIVQSDDKYYSVITEEVTRTLANKNADELHDYNGFINETEDPNDRVLRSCYEDGEGLVNADILFEDEPGSGYYPQKELYQIWTLRGSSAYIFDTLQSLGCVKPEREYYKDGVDIINFQGSGAYPTYINDLTISIRLKFANLADPTTANPAEYSIKFYNFWADKWDVYRLDNNTLDTYASGIYQLDILELDRGTTDFSAYFDPNDRMTMLMRVGVKYTKRDVGPEPEREGRYQEIDIDYIKYEVGMTVWEGIMALITDDAPGYPTSDWYKDPEFILECKSNLIDAGVDDVLRATWLYGAGPVGEGYVPTGLYDQGVSVPTGTDIFYDEEDSSPLLFVAIYTSQEVKLDIDSALFRFFPMEVVNVPSRWYYDANHPDEIKWEVNVSTSTITEEIIVDFSENSDVDEINTPYGDDATVPFTFNADELKINKTIIGILGYGTWQVIASSPNFITGASIADSGWDPIGETTYTSPVRHYCEILNFNDLLNAGKIGSVTVDFLTESGGDIYYIDSDIESVDALNKIFKGQTVFNGSSVGVVDATWTWSNGKDVGYFPGQFVMLGKSDDPPFVKIFNPEQDERVKDDEILYVAIVAVEPEDVVYTLDGSLTEGSLIRGFYEAVEGVSAVLQDYMYYADIPVDVFEHATNHLVTVRATEGVNNKERSQVVSFQVDKKASVSITSIDLSYDDEPTGVNVSHDNDIVLMNVYLDNDRIGTLKGNNLKGEIKIPRLNSGTYFLRLEVRDEIGNWGSDTASFFVNQRNPTLFGTLFQWFGDFFKILGIMILSVMGMGVVIVSVKKVRARNLRDKKCPLGSKWNGRKCEVSL